MSTRKILLVLTAVPSFLILTSCSGVGRSTLSGSNDQEIRNVILMIGDGMGLAQVYAAMTVSEIPLNIEKCTYTGLQKSFSASDYITDSGASGTAIATGTKTNNYSIGVDPQGKKLKSILEIAEENNLSTGLVSTSALTHATPAAFIAHQANRGSYEDIALDFLNTDVDVIIGGGYNHFARRKDKLNLADSLKKKGYEVVSDIESMKISNSAKLAAFTAPEHNPYRLAGRGDMLPVATRKAIDILNRNKNGFFLMVEGSQIDWAGHDNSADTLVDEVLDFDQAVGMALDFAERDGHTLVVVTADHETGGVSLTGGSMKDHSVEIDFAVGEHTAIMLPVYAYGPGAEKFTGIYDNTDIFKKIKSAFGF